MKLLQRLRRRRHDEVRKVYAAWAPAYDLGPGNPVQRANDAALALCVPNASERGVALDLGCGTGHHQVLLRARGWERVFGFDLSPEMLKRTSGYSGLAVAELHQVPARPVELVLCSLVLGHVEKLDPALDALARLVRYGGDLVLSELHPRALRMGLAATCPGSDGRWWRLPHSTHDVDDVVRGLSRRGLAVELVTEPAPEPLLPREPRRPLVPLVYALRARRVVG
ncbi:MAG: methyltransferase domain-containing protein [Deltaproteobacteria bacterium]|nr:methyltransferase domain-containing protein [Deltaproteobacteria bacterium]